MSVQCVRVSIFLPTMHKLGVIPNISLANHFAVQMWRDAEFPMISASSIYVRPSVARRIAYALKPSVGPKGSSGVRNRSLVRNARASSLCVAHSALFRAFSDTCVAISKIPPALDFAAFVYTSPTRLLLLGIRYRSRGKASSFRSLYRTERANRSFNPPCV